MRRYRKTFKCSENFTAREGDDFLIREGLHGRVVELWTVIQGSHSERGSRGAFTVSITEYKPVDNI